MRKIFIIFLGFFIFLFLSGVVYAESLTNSECSLINLDNYECVSGGFIQEIACRNSDPLNLFVTSFGDELIIELHNSDRSNSMFFTEIEEDLFYDIPCEEEYEILDIISYDKQKSQIVFKINRYDSKEYFERIFSEDINSSKNSEEDINSSKEFNYSLDYKIAIIEFVFKEDTKKNYYYDFYCNEEKCEFRTPSQEENSFISRCGINCEITRLSFFEMFNNPEGITEISAVNSENKIFSYYSIFQLKNFYEREAKKYGVNLNIDIDIYGPYETQEESPERLREGNAGEEFYDFFRDESKKQNVPVLEYGIVSYVYFGEEYHFVSTPLGKNETFNDMIISFDEILSNLETIIHETGHLFGGKEGYLGSGGICKYPDFYPDPNKIPLYPQINECIMCGSIMEEEGVRVPASDISQLVVCNKTALDFGWIQSQESFFSEIGEGSFMMTIYEDSPLLFAQESSDFFKENGMDHSKHIKVTNVQENSFTLDFYGKIKEGIQKEDIFSYYFPLEESWGDYLQFFVEDIDFEENFVNLKATFTDSSMEYFKNSYDEKQSLWKRIQNWFKRIF